MSNYLAIAAVTATLKNLIEDGVKLTHIDNTSIDIERPDKVEAGAAASVKLFLYQATPNAAGRNEDLPTRRNDGTIIKKPRAALDLHYLLSFTGNEKLLEPQRLLGSVTAKLHSESVLTRERIVLATFRTQEYQDDPSRIPSDFKFLTGSDLDQDIDLVRLTPLALSLEDLSKLWSIFFQVPYMLSVAYTASIVFIERDEMAQQVLPVRVPNIAASTFVVPPGESNVDPAPQRPAIDGSPKFVPPNILVKITQEIGPHQRVELLLNQIGLPEGAPPQIYTLPALPQGADKQQAQFAASGIVGAGTYLVRIRINGVESELTTDDNPASPAYHQYVQPQVTV